MRAAKHGPADELSTTTPSLTDLVAASRVAARKLASATSSQKDAALRGMAQQVRAASAEILAANAEDVAQARKEGKPAAFVDRLELNEKRLDAMARAIEEIVALADPIGEVTETWR